MKIDWNNITVKHHDVEISLAHHKEDGTTLIKEAYILDHPLYDDSRDPIPFQTLTGLINTLEAIRDDIDAKLSTALRGAKQ